MLHARAIKTQRAYFFKCWWWWSSVDYGVGVRVCVGTTSAQMLDARAYVCVERLRSIIIVIEFWDADECVCAEWWLVVEATNLKQNRSSKWSSSLLLLLLISSSSSCVARGVVDVCVCVWVNVRPILCTNCLSMWSTHIHTPNDVRGF